MLKLGAIHRPPPPTIRSLGERARLSLMSVPVSADWLKKCPADGDMLGNDIVSDCVEAAMLRAIQVRRANAWGDTWVPTKDMAFRLYAALSGFDPTTLVPDNGTDTVAAMTMWSVTGYDVDDQNIDVVCWATVDHNDDDHLALAIAGTGPVQVSLALPLAAQDLTTWSKPPGTGDAWVPASWGYHRVMVGTFVGEQRTCRTWGQDVLIHPDFWSAYVVGVDATLSREFLETTGFTPTGLDWDQLEADLQALAA